MEDIYAQAKKVILKNVKKGVAATRKGLYEYTYVCPARSVYPHQWLWDSCFHTIVTSKFNRRLAKAELRSLVSQIGPDGFIPQIIVWEPGLRVPVLGSVARWIHSHSHYTKLTQPPVLGIALEEVYHNTADRYLLEEMLPEVKRHYEYFAQHRDPDGDGLVSIVLPIESGMDHSPAFDFAMNLKWPVALSYHIANIALAFKYSQKDWDLGRIFDSDLFSVEDLTVNSIFAAGLRSVSRLCSEMRDGDSLRFAEMADRTERAIVERCYDADAGVFYSLQSKQDLKIPVKTVASIMPLMLESLPQPLAFEIVDKHLLNSEFFWLRYPLPSVSMCQDQFDARSGPLHSKADFAGLLKRQYQRFRAIWRGPTWVNTNWLVARGLRQHGMDHVADLLTQRTVEMVRNAGFWEHYNPLTGQGQGAEDYSWSALVVDMIDNCPDKRLVSEGSEETTGGLEPLTTPVAT